MSGGGSHAVIWMKGWGLTASHLCVDRRHDEIVVSTATELMKMPSHVLSSRCFAVPVAFVGFLQS